MQYIQGSNRHQSYFSTLEAQVATDNAVRLVDAFIDKLDLPQLGFASSTAPAKRLVCAALCADAARGRALWRIEYCAASRVGSNCA